MVTKSGETPDSVAKKINTLTIDKITQSIITISAGTVFYRLQEGEHAGSGVFFNHNGEHSRYGLTNGSNGSLYLANSPRTSMKEVFQNLPAITDRELDEYHMVTLVTEKDLRVVDITLLAPKMHVTAHQPTGTDYRNTQKLAAKLLPHANGLVYMSNVTLEPCVVLWHNDPSGKGVIHTAELKVLRDFEYEGEIAEDILVNDLDIPVI
ncbi:RES family NAD+ phosphorylase [Photorhabdus cinerea]|uniref:RES domain-containing protein n=1 Tax=Photorhabdus cinerea TaxID=471575 RepID=A0A7X5TEY0_9GAMM|nr:RES family NAD+ phosphorylase [Photorhabdus cinerea]NHB91126.1 RES domain-containing protein [Photorhabdus cinerea]